MDTKEIDSLKFNELTKDVTDGMWVAISEDGTRLVAVDITLGMTRDKAEECGEQNPQMYRVRRF